MILVTGSTGLVGRHLLRSLTDQGQKVRALYRSEDKRKEVEAFYAFAKAESQMHLIDWAQGDLIDVPRLSEIFDGISHVYHCAALISFDPYTFNELVKINIEGTSNIVNLCLSNHIQKLVHLSSIAVLAALPNKPITEENYWDPNEDNSVYALTKYGAEMEVWRGTQEGLSALIFNPGIILGEGDYEQGSGAIFKHVLKEESFYPKGSAAIIDVKDLVSLMIEGMSMELSGERYIAISHHLSYLALFTAISKTLKKKAPHRPLQNWVKPFLLAAAYVFGIFTRKRRITNKGFTSLQEHKEYDNKKLVKTFNFTPTHLENSLERIAQHILSKKI